MRTILFLSLVVVISCTTGKCREQKKMESAEETVFKAPPADLAPTQPASSKNKPPTTVKVFKYDGSKQCEEGGASLEEMEKALKGIKVISKSKANDGKMRIQMCGADTGQANVFEIPSASLKAAQDAGFSEWKH